jgi:peptidyl-dipeptidase A
MTMLLLLVAMMTFGGCTRQTEETDAETFDTFITGHLEIVEPLQREAALAYWEAATTGNEEAYDRSSELELKIREIYSNPSEFAFLRNLRESGSIRDSLLIRQLQVLYNAYLVNQIEPSLLKQIVELSTGIEKEFNTFRGTISGQRVTTNEIKEILKKELGSDKRKQAWLADKQVGPVVSNDLVRLVKLRNQAARSVGFDNFHILTLITDELDVKELDGIFEELYELTNEPFSRVKGELDRILSGMYGVAADELMPWHYHDPFFQETPMVYELDLDVYYEETDVKELARQFFSSIGMPVESILARSDLYEREGKNPHAFCTDIDRRGDVRILCNLRNNETWMETILHELGHGVYDLYHDPKVPYLLREPAHIFTTEAVAMFFGRLSRNPAWMQAMLDLTDEQRADIEEVSGKYAQLKQLIFARWAMVMYNFEKALYADPDQDLNRLWWDMVEKYQMVNRPANRDEPDWAAKIHFTIAPCYYHNYMLGELFASQLHSTMIQKVLKLDSDEEVGYVGRGEAGNFLKENVLKVGKVYPWNKMIERATGEGLTAKYFVVQFVN